MSNLPAKMVKTNDRLETEAHTNFKTGVKLRF